MRFEACCWITLVCMDTTSYPVIRISSNCDGFEVEGTTIHRYSTADPGRVATERAIYYRSTCTKESTASPYWGSIASYDAALNQHIIRCACLDTAAISAYGCKCFIPANVAVTDGCLAFEVETCTIDCFIIRDSSAFHE